MKLKKFFGDHITLFRIFAALIAFAMIAGLLYFAFSLNGNPVSYFLAKSSAEKYAAENYPGYNVNSVAYNFKFGNYAVQLQKPDSEDCHFMASFGLDGKLLGDNFEGSVTRGFNTMARLNMRYRELVNTVLESPAYPFDTKIGFGELLFEGDDPDVDNRYIDSAHPFSLSRDILTPDGLYDIRELGESGGLLTIYVYSEDKTPERAAEVLLELDSLMTRGGVSFHSIDLLLTSDDGEDYILTGFDRGDIFEDGLADRAAECHRLSEERFSMEFEKKLS